MMAIASSRLCTPPVSAVHALCHTVPVSGAAQTEWQSRASKACSAPTPSSLGERVELRRVGAQAIIRCAWQQVQADVLSTAGVCIWPPNVPQ